MAKRIKQRRSRKKPTKRSRKVATRIRSRSKERAKLGSIAGRRRRPGISAVRLERGLRVLGSTKDIKTAARAIHVSVDRFKYAARRKAAIRKLADRWSIARQLPRRMPIFTGNRQIAIKVRANSASLIGRYMSAVGQFLQTNDPKFLADFSGRSVKDIRGKVFRFETNPNALYRLSSADGEPFEELYRIVL